ncbi:MAG: hypothetical protein V8S24_16750 [Gordonibacter pamelaeae]
MVELCEGIGALIVVSMAVAGFGWIALLKSRIPLAGIKGGFAVRAGGSGCPERPAWPGRRGCILSREGECPVAGALRPAACGPGNAPVARMCGRPC